MGFNNNFNIEITEIRHLDIAIEAETEKEALAKSRMNYTFVKYVSMIKIRSCKRRNMYAYLESNL